MPPIIVKNSHNTGLNYMQSRQQSKDNIKDEFNALSSFSSQVVYNRFKKEQKLQPVTLQPLPPVQDIFITEKSFKKPSVIQQSLNKPISID
jgi:hypothetical protein